MCVPKYTAIVATVLATLANAVIFDDDLRPDYSSQLGNFTHPCELAVVPLTLTYNTCFQIPLLITALTTPHQFIEHTENFLTALCAPNAPMCPEEEVKKTAVGLSKACYPDFVNNPGGVHALTTIIMENYPVFKGAVCSRNMNGTFCGVEILTRVQSTTGVELNYNIVRDAINGNSTYEPQLLDMLDSGALCTGCVSRFLYLGTQLKTTVPLPSALTTVRDRCGSWFGSQEIPTGVDDPAKHVATQIAVTQLPSPKVTKASGAAATLRTPGLLLLGPTLLTGLAIWNSV